MDQESDNNEIKIVIIICIIKKVKINYQWKKLRQKT